VRRPLDVRGGLFALLLSTLWAGNPIATKTGLESAPPLRFGYLRFALGLAVVVVWAVATRQSLKVTRGELWPLFVLGSLFVVQLAFLNYGQEYTTASHAVVLNTTMPLWVAVLSHFMIPGDRLSASRFGGILVAYAGVVVLFWRGLGQDGATLLGDGLTLISAVLLAERLVYVAKQSQRVSVPKLLMAQGVMGIAAFAVASLLIENDAWLWNGEFALAMFYTGAVIAGFGFIGNTWLLSKYLPSRVMVISLTQPFVGVLLSWWLLDERIGSELWIGAGCVVVGSYIVQRKPAKEKKDG
jgi:drug/metabolite transporter (DMT)-like permease